MDRTGETAAKQAESPSQRELYCRIIPEKQTRDKQRGRARDMGRSLIVDSSSEVGPLGPQARTTIDGAA
jgi:hypothetical protein